MGSNNASDILKVTQTVHMQPNKRLPDCLVDVNAFYLENLNTTPYITLDLLFSEKDFVIPPQGSDRELVQVKLGSLLIEFCPGGKDSFILDIKLIDKEKKSISQMFNFNGERSPKFQFEDIVPFSLGTFYSARTGGINRNILSPEERHSATEFRELLISMSLGKTINQQAIIQTISNLLDTVGQPKGKEQIKRALDTPDLNTLHQIEYQASIAAEQELIKDYAEKLYHKYQWDLEDYGINDIIKYINTIPEELRLKVITYEESYNDEPPARLLDICNSLGLRKTADVINALSNEDQKKLLDNHELSKLNTSQTEEVLKILQEKSKDRHKHDKETKKSIEDYARDFLAKVESDKTPDVVDEAFKVLEAAPVELRLAIIKYKIIFDEYSPPSSIIDTLMNETNRISATKVINLLSNDDKLKLLSQYDIAKNNNIRRKEYTALHQEILKSFPTSELLKALAHKVESMQVGKITLIESLLLPRGLLQPVVAQDINQPTKKIIDSLPEHERLSALKLCNNGDLNTTIIVLANSNPQILSFIYFKLPEEDKAQVAEVIKELPEHLLNNLDESLKKEVFDNKTPKKSTEDYAKEFVHKVEWGKTPYGIDEALKVLEHVPESLRLEVINYKYKPTRGKPYNIIVRMLSEGGNVLSTMKVINTLSDEDKLKLLSQEEILASFPKWELLKMLAYKRESIPLDRKPLIESLLFPTEIPQKAESQDSNQSIKLIIEKLPENERLSALKLCNNGRLNTTITLLAKSNPQILSFIYSKLPKNDKTEVAKIIKSFDEDLTNNLDDSFKNEVLNTNTVEEQEKKTPTPKNNNNKKVSYLLIKSKDILPYMFWDNATSITKDGKTPDRIEQEEPGYFSALSNALLHALDDNRIHQDISLDELKRFHHDCASRTKRLNRETQPGETKGIGQHYSYTPKDFKFDESFLDSLTEDANLFSSMGLIPELEYAIIIKPSWNDLITNRKAILDKIENKGEVEFQEVMFNNDLEPEVLDTIIKKLIDTYNNNVKSASSNDDKIKAIIQFIRPLQRLHPFPDANGRTMFMILLNRELVKHGMLPVIPDNPNDIDICSTDKAVSLIKEGQARFQDVVIDKKTDKEGVKYHNIRNSTSGALTTEFHQQAAALTSSENFLDPEYVLTGQDIKEQENKSSPPRNNSENEHEHTKEIKKESENQTVKEEVDIYDYPKVDHPLQLGNKITIGDLHGNSMKLIYMLLKHGIAQGIDESDYQKLVEIYRKCIHAGQNHRYLPSTSLTSVDLKEFNTIIEKLSFNKEIAICLIGDELADRGSNDYFTLKLLDKLHSNHVPLEILYSNHSMEFLNEYSSQKKDGNVTFDGNSLTVGVGQADSLLMLGELISKGLITQEEVIDLVEKGYKPSIKALSFILSEDNSEISIFSHAPISMVTISNLAKKLDVEFKDATALELAMTITAINDKFQQKIIDDQVDSEDKVESQLRKPGKAAPKNPIYDIAWSRNQWYGENKHNGYKLNYVHGHDMPKGKLPENVVNLDNNLGKYYKGQDANTGEYAVLITKQQDLFKLYAQLLTEIESITDPNQKILAIQSSSLLKLNPTTPLLGFDSIKAELHRFIDITLKNESKKFQESAINLATALLNELAKGTKEIDLQNLENKHPELYKALNSKRSILTTESFDVLNYAMENNHFDLFVELVKDGANINSQNSVGDTLLHIAIKQANFDAISFLVSQGANPIIKNNEGISPIENITDPHQKISIIQSSLLLKPNTTPPVSSLDSIKIELHRLVDLASKDNSKKSQEKSIKLATALLNELANGTEEIDVQNLQTKHPELYEALNDKRSIFTAPGSESAAVQNIQQSFVYRVHHGMCNLDETTQYFGKDIKNIPLDILEKILASFDANKEPLKTTAKLLVSNDLTEIQKEALCQSLNPQNTDRLLFGLVNSHKSLDHQQKLQLLDFFEPKQLANFFKSHKGSPEIEPLLVDYLDNHQAKPPTHVPLNSSNDSYIDHLFEEIDLVDLQNHQVDEGLDQYHSANDSSLETGNCLERLNALKTDLETKVKSNKSEELNDSLNRVNRAIKKYNTAVTENPYLTASLMEKVKERVDVVETEVKDVINKYYPNATVAHAQAGN